MPWGPGTQVETGNRDLRLSDKSEEGTPAGLPSATCSAFSWLDTWNAAQLLTDGVCLAEMATEHIGGVTVLTELQF